MRYAKNIGGEWKFAETVGDGPAAAAQAGILEAQGYRPVREAKRPAATPFWVWSASYAEDGAAVEESWWRAPAIIELDRAKLLAAAEEGGWLDAAVAYFQGDAAAQAWWADNMTYVEGSAMAERAMAALGLTLEQARALVLRCRK